MRERLATILHKAFPYTPTGDQKEAIRVFVRFVLSDVEKALWVLKGSAGTGKTTLVRAMTRAMDSIDRPYVLLAPTGRAAKVLASYTGKSAGTIHRKIYYPSDFNAGAKFRLRENHQPNTLFIVDEASMIADDTIPGEQALLADLIRFVYASPGSKMILIGDEMQLPPVGSVSSPALDKALLERRYDMRVAVSILMETVRHGRESEILTNAVALRQSIISNKDFRWEIKNREIIVPEDAYELQDALYESFEGGKEEQSLFITRSNKRANIYNRQIRSHIRGSDEIISAGDHLMVVKNNYYYRLPDAGADFFIANGDRIVVQRVMKYVEKGGFRFVRVEIYLEEMPGHIFEAVLWIDTLDVEQAAMPVDAHRELYSNLIRDVSRKQVLASPFFNALQVKYAYAVTAHKAQGGQWNRVFIEKPYGVEAANTAYKKWLYTALTRAIHRVYLIGFHKEDFIK
jgi:exodeoxyribonuclease-5